MLQYLPIVATILGQGLKAAGQVTSGYEANEAYEFNAGVARANAQAVKASSEFDIYRMKKAKKRFASAQVAGYSKAGVKLEGSPIEVMIDSAADAEIDMFINKYNAQTKQSQLESEAQQSERAGKSAIRQGILGGVSTLLSTAGSFYTGK